MARPLRVELAGGFYHVMNRGLERRAIFEDNADRLRWVTLLSELPNRFGVRVHAWVLMGNHYHLQIETPEANLSRAIQWLNVAYAVWFNRRHGRVGPLFQGRFKAEITDTAEWVARTNLYVHLNPVRVSAFGLDKAKQARGRSPGGVARSAVEELKARWTRLTEYRWSSCRSYLGLEAAPGWLEVERVRREFGGRSRQEQTCHYRQALRELIGEGGEWAEGPWEQAVGGLILGGVEFVERMRKRLGAPSREARGRKGVVRREPFVAWKRRMARVRGQAWSEFAEDRGDAGRDLAMLAARRLGRMTLRELGVEVGLDYGSVSNALYRIRLRLGRDREVQHEWEALLKCSYQET